MDSKSVTSAGSRITECSICFEEFVNPRSLPCLHTFCSHCLVSHIRRNMTRNYQFECPYCRLELPLKSSLKNGESLVDQFPKNNYMIYIQDHLADMRTKMKKDMEELRKEKVFLKDFYETELDKLRQRERETDNEKEEMMLKHRQECRALENEIQELKEKYEKELNNVKHTLEKEISHLNQSHRHERDALTSQTHEINEQYAKQLKMTEDQNRAVTEGLVKQINEERLKDETTTQNLLHRQRSAMLNTVESFQQKMDFLRKRLDEESVQRLKLRQKLDNEIKRRNHVVLKLEGSTERTQQLELTIVELQEELEEERRRSSELQKENDNILDVELDQKRKLHVLSLLLQASKIKEKSSDDLIVEYTKEYPHGLWGEAINMSNNVPYPEQAAHALEQYIYSCGGTSNDDDEFPDDMSTITMNSVEESHDLRSSKRLTKSQVRTDAFRRPMKENVFDESKTSRIMSSRSLNLNLKNDDINSNTLHSAVTRRQDVLSARDMLASARDVLQQYDQSKKELVFKLKKLNQLPKIKVDKK